MIEVYVKWCCDMEHIIYQANNNKLAYLTPTSYVTKQYDKIICDFKQKDNEAEQMTIFDYTKLDDMAI